MSCLHAFISVCIILYRSFQDHSNTYLYVNYSMKTFRFSLTPRVRKTKSNTTTIIQHAHVCIYYILYIYIYIYQYVLLFVTLISIRLFNYYSPRTQSFRCALVMCKQKCIFYGSPSHGGVCTILYYYFIIIYRYIICGYRRRRCVLLLRTSITVSLSMYTAPEGML